MPYPGIKFYRMLAGIRMLIIVVAFCSPGLSISAQPLLSTNTEAVKAAKPFRILTSGRQITIKSTPGIKSLLVWTASGNRILEQRDLNTTSYNFRIPANEKIFFVMVELVNGKRYSEKIGL